jgi:hypothetical protein
MEEASLPANSGNVALVMLAVETFFCASCFVLFGILTRQYNRRLIENGLAEQPNYIFSTRVWNNLAAWKNDAKI